MNTAIDKHIPVKSNKTALVLFWYYILVNLAPSLYFFFNQPVNFAGRFVVLLFPLGLYMLIFSLVKNPGKWQVFLVPLLFLNAFQIVLFYIYGQGVIASDMFINLFTTNGSETDELLGAILPGIAIVCLLYIPPLILGATQWKRKNILRKSFRSKVRRTSLLLILAAVILSFFGKNEMLGNFSFSRDVYPVNALYNFGFALNKLRKINDYPNTSHGFTFDATRTNPNRQIIVLVIGETSRAGNWQLYGYPRKTNPLLSIEKNLIVFRDALTESNVTHKSVPIILSSNGAADFSSIFDRKGICEAFDEVGFTTVFLSNQDESFSLIHYFAEQADIFKTLRKTDPATGEMANDPDGALIPLMKRAIDENPGNLFIVLHTYGSHFNYADRYPPAFRKFRPDKVENVDRAERTELINSYDNSIRYTDYVLNQAIGLLKNTHSASFLLYVSDHGEDIFDDDRNKFLHASPYPTYYQLRIPFLLWFSDAYKTVFPKKAVAARENQLKPVSTNAVFHTLVDAAGIKSPYAKPDLSVVNPRFTPKKRLFLNDHDKAVPYIKMITDPEDFELLKKNNIHE